MAITRIALNGATPLEFDGLTLDWSPATFLMEPDSGQSMAAATRFVGQRFTLYGQRGLYALSDESWWLYKAGVEWTNVFRVRCEIVEWDGHNLRFRTVADAGNFFRVYADPLQNANSWSGLGFSEGTLVYEGSFGVNQNFDFFRFNPTDAYLSSLDGAELGLATTATYVNPAYFPDYSGHLRLLDSGYSMALSIGNNAARKFWDGAAVFTPDSAVCRSFGSAIASSTLDYASQTPGEQGLVSLWLRAVVYTAGAVLQPVALNVVTDSAGGVARAPLAWRVGARARLAAPLLVSLRNPRFAWRAADPDPVPSPGFYGAAYVALACNVYDTVVAGVAGTVESCSLFPGIKVCLAGNVCVSAFFNMAVNEPHYAFCAMPLPFKAFRGLGAVRLPVLSRVLPVARWVGGIERYHSLAYPYSPGSEVYAAINQAVGNLISPVQLSRVEDRLTDAIVEPGVGTDFVFLPNGGVPPRYSGDPRTRVGVRIGLLSAAPEFAARVRVSSMMRGHARFEHKNFCMEVWPDGTVSLERWGVFWGEASKYSEDPLLPWHGSDSGSDGKVYGFPTVQGVAGTYGSGSFDSVDYFGFGQRAEASVWRPRVVRFREVYRDVFDTVYDASTNLRVVDTLLEDTSVYGGNRAVALLECRVGIYGGATAPLLIGVGAGQGRARVWLFTRVSASGAASGGLSVLVYDAAGPVRAALSLLVSGPVSGADSPWRYAVRVAGVDVSDRITGEIKVEAEAGAARIAHFVLAPTGTALDLAALGSAAVEIDYSPPGSGAFWRLFTGRLAEQEIDVASGALACLCSDGRAALLDALDAPGIEAITPGAVYSPTVHGAALAGAALAEARLATLAADLDLSPAGAWRLSPWESAPSPHFFLAGNGIIDESLSVRLMRYADAVPRVEVAFEYRYPLLRERQAAPHWHYDNCAGYFRVLGAQPFYLTGAIIKSAAEQEGWSVPYLDAVPSSGNASYAYWTQRRRYSQTVTESLSLSVRSPLAEAAYGPREVRRRRANLVAEFDATEWARDAGKPPLLSLPGFGIPGEGRLARDDQAVDGRAVADTAIRALLLMARRDILESLRGSRASARVPLNPRLDLPHTVRVDTARVAAVGRVVRLVHTLGVNGEAITEFELASFATQGVNPDATPMLAPAPLPVPDSNLDGFAPMLGGAIARDTGPEPDWEAPGFSVFYRVSTTPVDDDGDPGTPPVPVTTHTAVRSQFAIHLPAIPDADAQPLTLTHAADFLVAVPIDEFALIA